MHIFVLDVIFWNFAQKYNDEKIFWFILQKQLLTTQIFLQQYHKNLREDDEPHRYIKVDFFP